MKKPRYRDFDGETETREQYENEQAEQQEAWDDYCDEMEQRARDER